MKPRTGWLPSQTPATATQCKSVLSPVIPLKDAGQNPTDTLMGGVYSPPSLPPPSTTETIHYAILRVEGKTCIGHLGSMYVYPM